jgi:hypothetical protein
MDPYWTLKYLYEGVELFDLLFGTRVGTGEGEQLCYVTIRTFVLKQVFLGFGTGEGEHSSYVTIRTIVLVKQVFLNQ